jgi:hypothetical protein
VQASSLNRETKTLLSIPLILLAKLVDIRTVTNVEWSPLMAEGIEGCVPETGEGIERSSSVGPMEPVIRTKGYDFTADES